MRLIVIVCILVGLFSLMIVMDQVEIPKNESINVAFYKYIEKMVIRKCSKQLKTGFEKVIQ
jgi:hypothetical protein